MMRKSIARVATVITAVLFALTLSTTGAQALKSVPKIQDGSVGASIGCSIANSINPCSCSYHTEYALQFCEPDGTYTGP